MQHGLRLNLNKTEFSTTDPNEIATLAVTCIEVSDLKILDQWYQPRVNITKLLHALTQRRSIIQ